MRRVLTLFFCFFVSQVLFSEIIEISSMDEISSHITKDSLVVFDIDETLLTTKQTLGGDIWFRKTWESLAKEGYSTEGALAKILPTYMNLQVQTEVKPMELITSALIHKFQSQGITVIGLTARSTELAYTTVAQLRSIEINLDKNPIKLKDLDLSTHFPLKYVEGILFAQSHHKGEILLNLLRDSEHPLEKVIFVDDKIKYVKQLEEVCAANNILFVGFRYGVSDANIQEYDPEVTDLQLKYFKEILSNDAAEQILEARRLIS